MAAKDIWSSAYKSLLGSVEKAYLEFEDERFTSNDVKVTQVDARSAGSLPGMSGLGNIGSQLEKAASGAAKLADAVGAMKKDVSDIAQSSRKYEVKFNPREITIQAKGGSGALIQKMNFAAQGKVSAKYSEMRTQIVMNVPLIFDDYERTDAFMMEKFSDPTALVRTGVLGGIDTATGGSYSVRPQVEGFIGALHDENTRKITLSWGKMSYKGILGGVDAEYTMFNMRGNPIRAVVNLSIFLVDTRVKDNDMGVWQESYDKIFGNGSTSLRTGVDHAGNLLNINL